MKKCPQCAEEIQDDARICRFCNRSVVSRAPSRRKLIIWIAVIAGLVFLVTLRLGLRSSVDTNVAALKSASPPPTAATPSVANDPVSIVKNGMLDIDRSITIGSAFDHYKYFTADWKTFQTENGRTVVQVEGSIELEKLDPVDIAKPLQKLESDMNQAAGFTAPGNTAYSPGQVQTREISAMAPTSSRWAALSSV